MRVLKISILNKKNAVLFISVLFLISFFSVISSALGYGSGFYNAEEKTNGTYYETLGYYDDYAYYKVNCRPGDFLDVFLTYSYPSDDLDLDLYDSGEYLVDFSSSGYGSENVYTSVYSITHYYIRVERDNPLTGTISFTLSITGATGFAIPGFEIFTLIFGVISLSGVIILLVQRKRKIIF